jgi:hypothetical protein
MTLFTPLPEPRFTNDRAWVKRYQSVVAVVRLFLASLLKRRFHLRRAARISGACDGSNGRDPQYGGHTRVDYCRFGFRGNRTRSRLLAVAREGRSKCSRNEGQPDGLMLSVFHGENTLPLKNPKRSMGTSLCVGTKKVVDAFNSLPAFTHGSYAPFGGTGSHITSSEDAR